MATYQPDAEWLVSFAADTPFFPENLAKKLLQRAQGNNYEVIVATHKNEIQPLFALWNISLLSKLEQHLHNIGNPKMQAWIKSQQHMCIEFENIYQDPFFNINTPADISAAESMSQSRYP
jgi:molybdopterin-guanine dinucleotide biosynthesis protein A